MEIIKQNKDLTIYKWVNYLNILNETDITTLLINNEAENKINKEYNKAYSIYIWKGNPNNSETIDLWDL